VSARLPSHRVVFPRWRIADMLHAYGRPSKMAAFSVIDRPQLGRLEPVADTLVITVGSRPAAVGRLSRSRPFKTSRADIDCAAGRFGPIARDRQPGSAKLNYLG
jgi:hypothetical protein